jgi:hypothetical protein
LLGADLPFGIDREYGMNERIRELMVKAGFDVEKLRIYPGGFPREDLLVLEDFAELIVRECARIAFDESAHAGRMNKPGNCLFGTNIGRRIEKHFGVEE